MGWRQPPPLPTRTHTLSSHPRTPTLPHSPLQRQEGAESREGGYVKQELVLGTHTSEGEQNYLMRAEVQLPLEESEVDAR